MEQETAGKCQDYIDISTMGTNYAYAFSNGDIAMMPMGSLLNWSENNIRKKKPIRNGTGKTGGLYVCPEMKAETPMRRWEAFGVWPFMDPQNTKKRHGSL